MWRFILVSFAFLGWSFYELSGGADYRPSANSLQARAVLDNQRPKQRPLRVNVIELARNDAVQPDTKVTRTITSLHDLRLSMGQQVAITLASTKADTAPIELRLPTVKITTRPLLPQTPAVSEAAQLPDPPEETLAEAPELSRVSGASVNLRTGPGVSFGRITSLKRGTEVIVLREPGNGWIKLRVVDTDRIGWMADTMVTLAAD